MSVPPFAAAFALSMTTAYLCDRYHVRGLVCVTTSITALIGFIIFLTSSSAHTRYGSPLSVDTWRVHLCSDAVNVELDQFSTARSSCNGDCHWVHDDERWGNFVDMVDEGSLSTAPKYVLGTRVMVAFSGGMAVGSAMCLGYFVWMNQKKTKMLGQEVKGMDGDLAPSFLYLL